MSSCVQLTSDIAASMDKDNSRKLNYSRLHFLYWKAAPTFLRGVFRDIWKIFSGSDWKDNTSFGKKLFDYFAGAEILGFWKSFQKYCIRSGNSNQWDLPLLLDVILNLLPLVETEYFEEPWNMTKKKVEILKNTRNILAHAGDDTLDDHTFHALWKQTVDVLISMGMAREFLEKSEHHDSEPQEYETISSSEMEANTLRLAGDVLFEKKLFNKAIAEYSKAIAQENIQRHLLGQLYSNRSASNFRLNKLQCAKDDAKSCITLRPQWFTGYTRLGEAYKGLRRFGKAALNLSIAIRYGDTSKSTLDAFKFCKTMEAKKPSSEHSDLDKLMKMYLSRNQDTKFAKGSIEDLLLKGRNYYWGSANYPIDYERAAQFFSKAADMKSAWGLYHLARMTVEGKGVEKDLIKGLELYLEAACQGYVTVSENGRKRINEGVFYACHELGLAYENGNGVASDEEKALGWFKKAVLGGHSGAAHNIANKKLDQIVIWMEYMKLSAYLGRIKSVNSLAQQFLNDKSYKLAQQFFHFSIHEGSTELKGRENEFVLDCDIQKNFSAEEFKATLEKEVRQGIEVGPILMEIERLQKECKSDEKTSECSRISEPKVMSSKKLGAIINHRKTLKKNEDSFKKFGKKKGDLKPTCVTVAIENVEFVGLKQIFFKDIENQKLTKLYSGQFLDVTVIEDAIVRTTSIQLLVEDGNGDVGELLISNYTLPRNCGKTIHAEIGYGCQFTILYPYLHTTMDGLIELHVDDPELLRTKKNLTNPERCRYCGHNDVNKIRCKKCNRVFYCSETCLRKDSDDLQHSIICLKAIN